MRITLNIDEIKHAIANEMNKQCGATVTADDVDLFIVDNFGDAILYNDITASTEL